MNYRDIEALGRDVAAVAVLAFLVIIIWVVFGAYELPTHDPETATLAPEIFINEAMK
jgi:hypothetical protein